MIALLVDSINMVYSAGQAGPEGSQIHWIFPGASVLVDPPEISVLEDPHLPPQDGHGVKVCMTLVRQQVITRTVLRPLCSRRDDPRSGGGGAGLLLLSGCGDELLSVQLLDGVQVVVWEGVVLGDGGVPGEHQ